MYDVAGNKLHLNDKVAFCKVGQSRLMVGIAVKFSKINATIQLLNPDGTRRMESWDDTLPVTLSRAPDQLCLAT